MAELNRFISFEGIDFSGKSTQIKLLVAELEQYGHRVMLLREPGGTLISEEIRKILLNREHMHMTDICETLLYSAARHQLLTEKIIPALLAGNFVIADRYVDSTTSYQGHGRRIPMDFIQQLNKTATENTLPALTFYLDVDLETMKERRRMRAGDVDRLENQKDDFYKRIRTGYLDIARRNPERFITLDGKLPVNEIQKRIWEFVRHKFSL